MATTSNFGAFSLSNFNITQDFIELKLTYLRPHHRILFPREAYSNLLENIYHFR
jgi:hypothetical protein